MARITLSAVATAVANVANAGTLAVAAIYSARCEDIAPADKILSAITDALAIRVTDGSLSAESADVYRSQSNRMLRAPLDVLDDCVALQLGWNATIKRCPTLTKKGRKAKPASAAPAANEPQYDVTTMPRTIPAWLLALGRIEAECNMVGMSADDAAAVANAIKTAQAILLRNAPK